MSNIVFSVIDTECESADQSFFPPRVRMTTRSTTQIATVKGYPEYIPSTPPKKYKTLTWSGYSEHAFWVNGIGTGSQLCGARYDYSGSGQIDSSGTNISDYTKQLTALCVTPNTTYPEFINGGARMIGWCNPPDGLFGVGCPFCSGTMLDGGNWSNNSIYDQSTLAHFTGSVPSSSFSIVDATHGLGSGTGSLGVEIGNPLIEVLVPTCGRGFGNTIGQCTWDNNYTSVLSDEYTDAEALTHATVITSNGATAENIPRTTGFTSRYTTVVYTLNLSNLIVGQSYIVSVRIRDQHFAYTTKTYSVVATSSTASVVDSLATPAAGGTLTVYDPTVSFAP